MSVCERPREANMALSWSRVNPGRGSLCLTPALVEVRPSRRPNSTGKKGPPVWEITQTRASMSAQETWFVQPATASTAAFALTTVSKPSPAREMSSELCLSSLPLESLIITEASHPCPLTQEITRTHSDEAVVEEQSEGSRSSDEHTAVVVLPELSRSHRQECHLKGGETKKVVSALHGRR
ncbi:unnamed protein product [Spirodela intermedia]|uniref:Uncharacterized protein n=2 Tax=Spirodela intermedia TaxID=51605 RepID=A0A7I8LDW2_SPIIN|nr:unnamed protein product [Spirodela intermedia]CAA6671102.1 unnamed protein product [Spirodela intermedia]CAA7408211.1 unnamed protein product [Spirodela intermedia]